MTRSAERPSWPGVAFLVVCAQLFVWNLYIAQRNQRTFGPDETPRVRSGNIATVAAQNPMAVVSQTFAAYHRLRLLEGKTLILSPAVVAHRFALERVSRVHVEVVDDALELAPESIERLSAQVDRRWLLDPDNLLYVIVEPEASRYVVATRKGGGLRLILPEALYQEERARVAPLPSPALPALPAESAP